MTVNFWHQILVNIEVTVNIYDTGFSTETVVQFGPSSISVLLLLRSLEGRAYIIRTYYNICTNIFLLFSIQVAVVR